MPAEPGGPPAGEERGAAEQAAAPAPAAAAEPGWRRANTKPSLGQAHSSIYVPLHGGVWRKVLAFAGPGLMVAVGYMDPGNWATDIAGGARFGYTLLSVVLLSNVMAIVLQHLALKLGVVTGRDLAQACRDHYRRPVALTLWALCEIAIAATDLAEVIGAAIALNLLFHLPLMLGVILTASDVLLVLYMQHRGFRAIEAIVGVLILLIAGCFAYEMAVAHPNWAATAFGLIPSAQIIINPGMLYIAVGIIGATVMPHNLYLHSSIVQTRAFTRDDTGRAMAVKFATLDSTGALLGAFFINAAILILSAAAFHGGPHQNIADIGDAYQLLTPVLGASMASVLFGVALLASGQNSTLTGTMAGQIVMEGFLDFRMQPWLRRMLTRLTAIVPAVIVAGLYGTRGVGSLLILSQVILSLQLSFAVIPLVLFTGDRRKMGRFANAPWLSALAWIVTALIVVMNIYLLWQTAAGWLRGKA